MTDEPLLPPSLGEIERLAQAAYRTIPRALRAHVQDLVIRVDDFPDEETLSEMDAETPFDLLGLYRGISLDQRSTADAPQDVDMVFLYRRPILDYWCESHEPLAWIVRHVLIHEIGHHFGFSDEDMAVIEEHG